MIRITAVSDIGMVRDLDEDSVAYVLFKNIYKGDVEERAVMALADGMGGHAAGEIASKLALDAVILRTGSFLKLDKRDEETIEDHMKETYFLAEKNIREWSANNKIPSMGTTLVMAVMFEDSVFFANVGDSRGYIFGKDEIVHATYDDSLVFSMAENGLISFRNMKDDPQKNIITKALGPVDLDGPKITRYNLQKGDIVVLCCDGLWETVEEKEIFQIIRQNPLEDAAKKLLRLALERGASDNVSFIIAENR